MKVAAGLDVPRVGRGLAGLVVADVEGRAVGVVDHDPALALWSVVLVDIWHWVPFVFLILFAAVEGLPRDVLEAGRVDGADRWQLLRHVTLPQLAPFFAAAARSGLALVWKIVLVVELLGRPNGVGYQLNIAFSLFDVATILAYALAFIVVVQLIEMVLLQPLEARANRWRR